LKIFYHKCKIKERKEEKYLKKVEEFSNIKETNENGYHTRRSK